MKTGCIESNDCRLPVSMCNGKCKLYQPVRKTYKGSPAGMYGEAPRVQIGKFSICKQSKGQFWIENDDGEGGAFSEALLEAHVMAFFDAHL